jgi:hypothetical protein
VHLTFGDGISNLVTHLKFGNHFDRNIKVIKNTRNTNTRNFIMAELTEIFYM